MPHLRSLRTESDRQPTATLWLAVAIGVQANPALLAEFAPVSETWWQVMGMDGQPDLLVVELRPRPRRGDWWPRAARGGRIAIGTSPAGLPGRDHVPGVLVADRDHTITELRTALRNIPPTGACHGGGTGSACAIRPAPCSRFPTRGPARFPWSRWPSAPGPAGSGHLAVVTRPARRSWPALRPARRAPASQRRPRPIWRMACRTARRPHDHRAGYHHQPAGLPTHWIALYRWKTARPWAASRVRRAAAKRRLSGRHRRAEQAATRRRRRPAAGGDKSVSEP